MIDHTIIAVLFIVIVGLLIKVYNLEHEILKLKLEVSNLMALVLKQDDDSK